MINLGMEIQNPSIDVVGATIGRPLKPPLCKVDQRECPALRWHGVSRDGGIVRLYGNRTNLSS